MHFPYFVYKCQFELSAIVCKLHVRHFSLTPPPHLSLVSGTLTPLSDEAIVLCCICVTMGE